jgi:PHD/YefM family antitoxin component YafN of YafNO toxin-antitoxin module
MRKLGVSIIKQCRRVPRVEGKNSLTVVAGSIRLDYAPTMNAISKKVVLDERGAPLEVILPWATYCEIAETLGWDLDAGAEADLHETRRDLEAGRREAFQPLTPP